LKQLTGISLEFNDLSGWDFSGQDLSDSELAFSTLQGADFSGATVLRSNLGGAVGLTKEQLYSTASYQVKNLQGIGLYLDDLSNWDLSGQDLTGANLHTAVLTATNISGSLIPRASFSNTTSKGFTKEQLYSTASYMAKDLHGISLFQNDLAGWNLSDQYLGWADLRGAILEATILTGADTRGLFFDSLNGAVLRNTILPDGRISGLDLNAGESFVLRDHEEGPDFGAGPKPPIAVTVLEKWTMDEHSTLEMVFKSDPWDSLISFEPGIPVQLGGTLELTFADGVNVVTQIGHTLRIFDWTGVSPTGAFTVSSPYTWDLSKLYTTGEVTLSAVPAIPGDFNTNGIVDAADYVVWRNGLGTTYTENDYDVWRAKFGLTAPAAGEASVNASLPGVSEPAGAILLMLGAIALVLRHIKWDREFHYTVGRTILSVTRLCDGQDCPSYRPKHSKGPRSRPSLQRLVFVVLLSTLLGTVASAQSSSFTLSEASVAEINHAFDEGVLTSERLVEMYLNRIAAYDNSGPMLNSLITVNQQALEVARQLDEERRTSGPRSPLHGIPVILKDNIDTFDLPTTAGSLALKDSIPPDDAFLVRRLRDAGAIIFGKANMDEFGFGLIGRSSAGGQTFNPYDLTRVPTGSSGGTAVAIAANLATVGFGADAIGSVRMPSSAASLVGLKPTLGLISRDGVVAYDRLRETAGPMTRTVTDLAIVLDSVAAPDPADPWTADSDGKTPDTYLTALRPDALRDVKLGRVPIASISSVGSVVSTAFQQLRDLGANLDQTVNLSFMPGWFSSLYDGFEHDMNRYLESLGPARRFADLDSLVASGEYLPLLDSFFRTLTKGDVVPATDPEYARILELRESMRQRVLNLMDETGYDALVYPTLATNLAPVTTNNRVWLGDAYFDLMNHAAFLGFPAITVPAGFTSTGLPIGIEFLGRPYSDADLIGYAFAFEQATHHRRPPSSTPPLPGETIPEPSAIVFSITAIALLRSADRRRPR
jgi:Asp-tRNA(Asn)/Glu-tRNA(Gln) amidotransferase A subunit family amidase/uncharacterized protein YjbI with pentapeptide repeats